MKVLIVEDDESLSNIIDRNFRARGHQSSAVDSAEAAVLRLMEDWPDVLVLDVNLPDYSAWEVLRRIGESRGRLRVIVVSAAPISRKRLDEFKPAAALQKPFPINALLHLAEQNEEPQPVNSELGRSDLV